MSKHSKIGIKGEEIASNFLLNKGYNILFRNWRYGNKEVDIIAAKNDIIVFVEVKTRSGDRYQFPEEAVNKKKQTLLKAAADGYTDQSNAKCNIRFDIVSVLLENDFVKEIVHFEEAF